VPQGYLTAKNPLGATLPWAQTSKRTGATLHPHAKVQYRLEPEEGRIETFDSAHLRKTLGFDGHRGAGHGVVRPVNRNARASVFNSCIKCRDWQGNDPWVANSRDVITLMERNSLASLHSAEGVTHSRREAKQSRTDLLDVSSDLVSRRNTIPEAIAVPRGSGLKHEAARGGGLGVGRAWCAAKGALQRGGGRPVPDSDLSNHGRGSSVSIHGLRVSESGHSGTDLPIRAGKVHQVPSKAPDELGWQEFVTPKATDHDNPLSHKKSAGPQLHETGWVRRTRGPRCFLASTARTCRSVRSRISLVRVRSDPITSCLLWGWKVSAVPETPTREEKARANPQA
jgi:hypothetical protein